MLKGAEAKKIIRDYNRTMQVLLEYEIVYHQAWIKSVDACQQGRMSEMSPTNTVSPTKPCILVQLSILAATVMWIFFV